MTSGCFYSVRMSSLMLQHLTEWWCCSNSPNDSVHKTETFNKPVKDIQYPHGLHTARHGVQLRLVSCLLLSPSHALLCSSGDGRHVSDWSDAENSLSCNLASCEYCSVNTSVVHNCGDAVRWLQQSVICYFSHRHCLIVTSRVIQCVTSVQLSACVLEGLGVTVQISGQLQGNNI